MGGAQGCRSTQFPAPKFIQIPSSLLRSPQLLGACFVALPTIAPRETSCSAVYSQVPVAGIANTIVIIIIEQKATKLLADQLPSFWTRILQSKLKKYKFRGFQSASELY
jgi:hypothetical protein